MKTVTRKVIVLLCVATSCSARFASASEATLLNTWGSYGAGDGQFNLPEGIAVGPDGSVYVADETNQRIQRFDTDGNFETAWGTGGSGDGQFANPTRVAVAPTGMVYVSLVVGDSGRGVGGTGTVYMNGDLPPGHSPASDVFGGHLVLGANCDTVMELAGTTPGSGYDQLLVADDLALDGTLDVVLLSGFAPAGGDVFQLLGGDLSGAFSTVRSFPAGTPRSFGTERRVSMHRDRSGLAPEKRPRRAAAADGSAEVSGGGIV